MLNTNYYLRLGIDRMSGLVACIDTFPLNIIATFTALSLCGFRVWLDLAIQRDLIKIRKTKIAEVQFAL